MTPFTVERAISVYLEESDPTASVAQEGEGTGASLTPAILTESGSKKMKVYLSLFNKFVFIMNEVKFFGNLFNTV